VTQKRRPPERSTRQRGGEVARLGAVSGCGVEATHADFEAALDPDSGKAVLRADARLPHVCATHVGQGGIAGRLTRHCGALAGIRGSAFLVPRLP
jgi:hypothetical protein